MWVFSSIVCWIVHGYCREKLLVNHLKSKRVKHGRVLLVYHQPTFPPEVSSILLDCNYVTGIVSVGVQLKIVVLVHFLLILWPEIRF